MSGTVRQAIERISERNDLQLAPLLREVGLGPILDDLSDAWAALAAPVEEIEIDDVDPTVRLLIRPALIPDLADLAAYLPGVDVVGALAVDDFPSFDTGLDLRLIEATIRFEEPVTVLALRVVVAPGDTSAWSTLDGLIQVDDLEADLTLDRRDGARELTVLATGRAMVGGGTLGASIELPARTFSIDLADGETVAIDALAAELLDLSAPLPSLDCTTLRITGDPDAGDYDLVAALGTDWSIVEQPELAVTDVDLDLTVDDADGPDRSTTADFGGTLAIGRSLKFDVRATRADDGWRFVGALAQPLTLTDVLDDVADAFGLGRDALAPAGELLSAEVSELRVTANAPTGDVRFVAVTGMEVGDQTVEVTLVIQLTNQADGGYEALLSGTLFVDGRALELSFTRTVEADPSTRTIVRLLGQYRDPDGTRINLVETVADLAGATVDDAMDLASVELHHLLVGYRQERTDDAATTTCLVMAELQWSPDLDWPAVTSLIGPVRPTIDATIELERELRATPGAGGEGTIGGSIWGEFRPGIEQLDALSLRLGYLLDDPTGFAIELQVGEAIFRAFRPTGSGASGNSLQFKVSSGSLTIGDIVSAVASLLDPSIDELSFDAPWTALTEFDLTSVLKEITLTIDWGSGDGSDRSIRFELPDLDLDGSGLGLPDGLLRIDRLGVEFVSRRVGSAWKRLTSIDFDGSILGKDVSPSWDPVNEAPPELPGQAPLVDLRYLAIGQHVAIQGVADAGSISEVMDLLGGAADARRAAIAAGRPEPGNPLTAFGGDASGVAFSAESQWLIALDIGLLRFIQLTVVFNDPIVYGLRLELDGEQAKNFAGLQFEILYQRINDTVGKYHTELVLPDIMRHLQLGAVSVTLPIIVVDIYTNGDFKVDLGFPWDLDFSRSAAAEVFPFVGAAGLYLAKLSALTATDSSVPTTNRGRFDPIYEFGLGIRIGLGKSFRSGPLKAEVSIAVEGIVEGVISWYEPNQLGSGGSAVVPAGEVDKELFYKVAGAVSIVGRVYGEVDFVVIKVRVEVVARATIAFAVERYQPILVALTAEVSVEASVEFLFITVDFSFDLTIEQRFTIDSPEPGPAPWLSA